MKKKEELLSILSGCESECGRSTQCCLAVRLVNYCPYRAMFRPSKKRLSSASNLLYKLGGKNIFALRPEPADRSTGSQREININQCAKLYNRAQLSKSSRHIFCSLSLSPGSYFFLLLFLGRSSDWGLCGLRCGSRSTPADGHCKTLKHFDI